MSWNEIQLGDFFQIKHGFAFKSQFFGDDGKHIVLTPGNFYEAGGFRVRPEKERYYAAEPPEDFVLKPGDLIVAMTEQGEGLLGSSAIIPSEGSFLHNQRIGLIENLNEQALNKGFLYRLFNCRDVRGQIRASASGTKVRHTAPKRIYSIRVKIPSLPEQAKIAEIASAYDDLIENNRRRIGLLEEAARLLYREWFVYFRFPGHEHVKITNGLPEGWEHRTLGEIADTNLESYRASELPEEINYVDISSVERGRIISKSRLLSSEAPGRARRRAKDGDVIWSNVRPNLRAYSLILSPEDIDVFSTGFTVITAREVPFAWLYLFVTTDSFVGHLVNHATGAGYPAVRPDDFERADVCVPPKSLLQSFQEVTEPIFRLISQMEIQNQKLVEARDLLLPRLMSGEIAV